MKLLKLTIPSGYKMLEKGFSINFLTKTRINKALTSNDLMQLEKGLYYPLETIFIGKNSSGKTTVLFLIHLILEFLKTGRIPSSYLCEQDRFELNVIFYSGGFIYLFEGSFVKSNLLNHNEFMLIEKESLKRTTYKKTYMKDLSNISLEKKIL